MNGLELETWADLQSEMNQRVCRINTDAVTENYWLFSRLSKRSLGTSSVLCVFYPVLNVLISYDITTIVSLMLASFSVTK